MIDPTIQRDHQRKCHQHATASNRKPECPMTNLKVGDRVRYDPNCKTAHLSEWKDQTATIIEVAGVVDGQGSRSYVAVKMDGSGVVQRGIEARYLLPE